jgi:hypothetical protein
VQNAEVGQCVRQALQANRPFEAPAHPSTPKNATNVRRKTGTARQSTRRMPERPEHARVEIQYGRMEISPLGSHGPSDSERGGPPANCSCETKLHPSLIAKRRHGCQTRDWQLELPIHAWPGSGHCFGLMRYMVLVEMRAYTPQKDVSPPLGMKRPASIPLKPRPSCRLQQREPD